MTAGNPQPLQACPFEYHGRGPIIEVEDDEFEDRGNATEELEEENVESVSTVNHGAIVMAARASELTLSFTGEVYVFPAVKPEKDAWEELAVYVLERSRGPCNWDYAESPSRWHSSF